MVCVVTPASRAVHTRAKSVAEFLGLEFVAVADALENLSDWNAESIEATFKSTAESLEINPGHVMQLFRVLLSGQGGGPVLFEMTELLGQEEVVERLREGVAKLK